MFNILAVSGSPRRGGNTESLVEAALAPLERDGHKIHRFFLSAKVVAPCNACDACVGDGVCVVDDDMQYVFKNLLSFDGMIVGSPVYNRNVSAQLQGFFNRFHCLMHRHPFQDRLCFGGALAVGNSPNSQGIVVSTIYSFLLSLGVCAVPAVLNGVSAVAKNRGEVAAQPKAMNDAAVLGRNLLRVLRTTRAGA